LQKLDICLAYVVDWWLQLLNVGLPHYPVHKD